MSSERGTCWVARSGSVAVPFLLLGVLLPVVGAQPPGFNGAHLALFLVCLWLAISASRGIPPRGGVSTMEGSETCSSSSALDSSTDSLTGSCVGSSTDDDGRTVLAQRSARPRYEGPGVVVSITQRTMTRLEDLAFLWRSGVRDPVALVERSGFPSLNAAELAVRRYRTVLGSSAEFDGLEQCYYQLNAAQRRDRRRVGVGLRGGA